MSIEAHINTIAKKRNSLKAEIASEMAHPSPDFARIKLLKKENLHLKEEMQRYFKLLRTSAAAS